MLKEVFADTDAADFPTKFCRHSKRSEVQFHRGLHNTRRRGADGLAKSVAANVAIDGAGTVELGVIEEVEGFNPKEKSFRLIQGEFFGDGGIEVIRPRAVKESASCSAGGTESIHPESHRVEVVVSVGARIVIEMK
jgi:hypothetical protein